MADTKISDLAALTGAGIAAGDLFVLVDVSDTTMDPDGTDKKMTKAELLIALGIPTLQYVVGDESGNHTTTSASFADVNAAYSLAVPAVAGDRLEITFTCSVFHSSATANMRFGASVGGTDLGTGRLDLDIAVANESIPVTYRMIHVVQSGEISGGTVAVKPRWLTSASTANMLNEGTNSRSPVFTVKNWRQ